jgi:predicted transposase YdaD
MGKTIADQFREEGLERGRAEGKAEGKAELLLQMCRIRFGEVAPAAEASLRGATVAQLDAWAERLLSAKSLAEVFG